jgi:uncharacterized protein YcsI (UPF0317 family)
MDEIIFIKSSDLEDFKRQIRSLATRSILLAVVASAALVYQAFKSSDHPLVAGFFIGIAFMFSAMLVRKRFMWIAIRHELCGDVNAPVWETQLDGKPSLAAAKALVRMRQDRANQSLCRRP